MYTENEIKKGKEKIPPCPYCKSTETRQELGYLFWLNQIVYSCDNCEGRIFTEDDIEDMKDGD